MAVSGQRAVLVPDAATWAAVGVDLSELGLEPVAEPSRADVLAAAERLPAALAGPAAELLGRLPDPTAVRVLGASPLGGAPLRQALEHRADSGPDHDDGREDHGDGQDDHGEGHGDMMAVTGEPSRDGLVMESATARIGPISAALPTGLTLELELDGDVVAAALLGSVLDAPADRGPSPLARHAAAWAAARATGPLDPERVAAHLEATELERALSHTMWLSRFADLLGWVDLGRRLRLAATPLVPRQAQSAELPRSPGREDLDPLASALSGLPGSRRLASRLRGLARVDRELSVETGLAGPVARASDAGGDARSEDPAYRELGFEPVLLAGGDALARTELRIREALASLGLAFAAADAGRLSDADGPVESPRGPLAAAGAGPGGARLVVDRGAAPVTRAAERTVEGLELASALVAVASFDLDPWTVAG